MDISMSKWLPEFTILYGFLLVYSTTQSSVFTKVSVQSTLNFMHNYKKSTHFSNDEFGK